MKRLALAVITVAALPACQQSDDSSASMARLFDPVESPTSGVGLAYATDDEAYLPDGRVIEVDDLTHFVVAGSGVFYVDDDGVFHMADEDGSQVIDAPAEPETIHASPDGRYVGWIEYRDTVNEEPAQAVVVDTTTGMEVLRDDHGQDVEEGYYLVDLYENDRPGFEGLSNTTAYVHGAGANEHSYDLTDPDPQARDLEETGYGADWFKALFPTPSEDSPDGTWEITVTGAAIPAKITGADGTVIKPYLKGDRSVPIEVDEWLDDTTLLGFAHVNGLNQDSRLAFCTVRSGACTALDERVVFPNDAGGLRPMIRSEAP